jgi:hypothetical protein
MEPPKVVLVPWPWGLDAQYRESYPIRGAKLLTMRSSASTSAYRAYVTAMKSKITQADLLAARASIDRSRRKKAAASAGKTVAALGSVALGVIGIVALAKTGAGSEKPERK